MKESEKLKIFIFDLQQEELRIKQAINETFKLLGKSLKDENPKTKLKPKDNKKES